MATEGTPRGALEAQARTPQTSETPEAPEFPAFLSMLAHELRNPLAPIRNATEVLRSLCADPRQAQAIDIIGRQVVHLTHLLDDLLDAARLRRGVLTLQLQTVDVGALAEQALETVRATLDARRQNLFVSLPVEPVLMRCDPVRLVQVLQNLLDNATRHTPEGGAIALQLSVTDRLRVEVSDTGAGIAPELLPRLFNVFAQGEQQLHRPRGGLGLGLAIARNLVEMHGGTISAHSAGTGRGSRFVVELPIEGALQARAAETMTETNTPRRILVIDDHEDIRRSLADFLSLRGNTVVVAADGAAGIILAQSFKPDAAIIDIGLPGANGFEVAQRLRELQETAGAVLIAVTGYSLQQFPELAARSAFDHYLLKPTAPETLLALIERSLKERTPPA